MADSCVCNTLLSGARMILRCSRFFHFLGFRYVMKLNFMHCRRTYLQCIYVGVNFLALTFSSLICPCSLLDLRLPLPFPSPHSYSFTPFLLLLPRTHSSPHHHSSSFFPLSLTLSSPPNPPHPFLLHHHLHHHSHPLYPTFTYSRAPLSLVRDGKFMVSNLGK